MIKGFSTGALTKGDFRYGLELLKNSSANAVELSALREGEVQVLLDSLELLDLDQFDYISFHAPSKLKTLNEAGLVQLLLPITEKKWPIIVHPDIISDYKVWRKLGKYLCIENMDKRKKSGRTSIDLEYIFKLLPDASFCFDIAHACQVDPTMTEAYCMVTNFKHRLQQMHVSSVNTQSVHEPLTFEVLLSYLRFSQYLPDIPIILESPVIPEKIEFEMQLAATIFSKETEQKDRPLMHEILNY